MILLVSKNQNRDPVDVMRVRYWYQGIMTTLDCQNPYQVEKLLEPERFKRKHQRTEYPNKWGSYVAGEHTPQIRHVRKVEIKVPGSARELNHPLWAILKMKMEGKEVSSIEWMGRLDPTVQTCVLQPQHDCFGAPRMLAPFSSRQGQKLLRRGDLDALAALVLYWGEADHQEDSEALEELGRMIYKLLLIVGLEFYRRNLSAELLVLFKASILDATPWVDGYFAVDAQTFEISILLLHHLSYPADYPGKTPQWRKQVGRMLLFLSGRFGDDIKFAMRPFCQPAWEAGPPTRDDWAWWEQSRRFWAWGWHCLLNRTEGKFPPYEDCVLGICTHSLRNRPLRRRLGQYQMLTLPDECVIEKYGEWLGVAAGKVPKRRT
ncbi:hypothetical protein ACFOKJ_12275 [Vogesella amnigena]|uniref:Uncharacterized protein n=1 Tax=Vogesella amnigena TaxID=1507449 RepID=A0ABV7TW73_9NEIS